MRGEENRKRGEEGIVQTTVEESGKKKSERSREIERWHGIREEEGGNSEGIEGWERRRGGISRGDRN